MVAENVRAVLAAAAETREKFPTLRRRGRRRITLSSRGPGTGTRSIGFCYVSDVVFR